VKTPIDRVAEVLRNLEALARTRVLVGIPEERNARSDGKASNALIGYIAENGSPAKNIPARPWLEPGVQQAMPQILKAQQGIGKAALEGRAGDVEQGLQAVGLLAQNAVRARISSNISPPLKPATIAARRRRSKGSTYRRTAQSAGDAVALVDTGQFRNAVSFIVKKT
jgi:hypothetical protein